MPEMLTEAERALRERTRRFATDVLLPLAEKDEDAGSTRTRVIEASTGIGKSFAYLVPAIFISMLITGVPVPQLGLGANAITTRPNA